MQEPPKGYINTKVAREKWEEAQRWEQDYWLRQQKNLAKYGKNFIWRLMGLVGLVEKHRGDDDNQWWSKQFDGYKFLPAACENMIEVGCGPYTNTRLVRQACKPQQLFLSDPLMRTYIHFKRTMVREMYETFGCYLDDHPLENLPFRDAYFDVAIMINVLDHVQDANACMATLLRILKPGGYMIMGQDLTNDEDFRTHPDGMRTGHPITLDAEWFDAQLKSYQSIVRKQLSREEGRTPQWHYGTLLFAGTKL